MAEYRDRKIPRANWHDYAGGIYCVTVVAENRQHYFGEICDNKMCLSDIGEYLEEQILGLSSHHKYAKLISHVVMPNHFHAIIYIDHDNLPYQLRTLETVNDDNKSIENTQKSKGWLSVVVGNLKSAVSAYAHHGCPSFRWQKRFHDHIIRNRNDMDNFLNYINNNVSNWGNDKFNTPIYVTNKGDWQK